MIILRMIDRLNIAIGRAVSFLIWVGIVVLCYEVVARYVFGQPTLWAHGYTQRIFGSYFVLVGAYTLIRKNHVRVDLLLNTGPPRWQAFLDLLNFSFLVLWGSVLTYEAFWFFEALACVSAKTKCAICAVAFLFIIFLQQICHSVSFFLLVPNYFLNATLLRLFPLYLRLYFL
jgi:TRAP-type mannitol/chloroaromatic compound transport system permease small subunit